MTAVAHMRRPGFTLVEALMSALVVSVMLTAALAAVGASARAQAAGARQWRARAIAASLLSEIVHLPYADPEDAGGSLLGPDSGEMRAVFDDVDDYAGLVESTVTFKDGRALEDAAGWSRSVAVTWVTEADPNTASPIPTHLKRVTVTACYKGYRVTECVAIRAAD